MMPIFLLFGANTQVIGKTEAQKLSYAGAFKPTRGSLADLAEHISKGHPWMPSVLDEGKPRCQIHANHAELLSADIDSGLTIERAKHQPFISAHCGLAIESASSTPEHNKFRLVFRLPVAVEGWQTIRICNRYLIERLGVADPACKDASRFYFGAPGRKPFKLNESAVLPADFVEQAISWNKEQELKRQKEQEVAKARYEVYKTERLARGEADNTDLLVEQALAAIPPRYTLQGQGTYTMFRDILWALKNHYGESRAITMMEAHSPSAQSGWNISQVVRGNYSHTLGTLFHHAKQYGFRFPKRETEEPKQEGADLGEYQASIEQQHELEQVEEAQEPEDLLPHVDCDEVVASGEDKGFQESSSRSNRNRQIVRRQTKMTSIRNHLKQDFQIPKEVPALVYEGYAPNFELAETIALQGWLGSGKTEATLRSLVPHKEQLIVWVAPTNGLLRQISERAQKLGFTVYYLQDNNSLYRHYLRTGKPGLYLACPDSFKSYAVDGVPWQKVILVFDEWGGTRENLLNKPVELPQILEAISRCRSFIAIDAFLGDVDLRQIIKNLRQADITVYRQKFQKSQTPVKWLEGLTKKGEISYSHDGVYYKLFRQWIQQGIRKFAIAVDSIKAARQLAQFIKQLDPTLKVWLTCSHTVEENQRFLADPDALIAREQVDVLIYSPTIQSGADIQSPFERGALLATGVLSPKQMLQMLGRCRQCAEWWVSAPRKSQNPAYTTHSLSDKKIRAWTDKVSQVFVQNSLNAPDQIQWWGVWQRLTREIEEGLGSEYLEMLLHEHFENIETIYFEGTEGGQWRRDRQILNREDAERTLNADLENGLKLIDEQKPPSTNQGVWDSKLAVEWKKYPKVIQAAISAVKQNRTKEDAIDTFLVFSGHRIKRLKHWVMATEPNAEDDADHVDSMRRFTTTYNSNRFKAFQFRKLFRLLKLARLAKCRKSSQGDNQKKSLRDVTHFDVNSPVISEIWESFKANASLKRIFPTLESVTDLWAVIRRCMAFLGYQSDGCNIRVETNELYPNGKDRQGRQRYSKSQSRYFSGWLEMEFSSNSFFQEYFELIIQAIRDLLTREREERRRRKESESGMPPPLTAAA